MLVSTRPGIRGEEDPSAGRPCRSASESCEYCDKKLCVESGEEAPTLLLISESKSNSKLLG